MRLLRLLTIPLLGFLKSGPDPSSSSIGANEEVRLRKEGVEYCRFAVPGVCAPSSSCFRFKGVPAKASNHRRLEVDCGVAVKCFGPGESKRGALLLLGEDLAVGDSATEGIESLLEGVALWGRSNIPRTWPSF